MQQFKLITVAGEIPDGAKVAKLRGTNLYTLKHAIVIYHATDGLKQTLASPDVRYLVGDNGSINAVSVSTELCWLATAEDMADLIDPIEDK